MNYELFIAKRLVTTKQHKSSISSPIIKIAITAIALGMIIMMIAIATGIGLQDKIREKIAGFNGHIQITNFDNNNSQITLVPISTEQEFYPEFPKVEDVEHIQMFATKAGIIRTSNDFEGVVVKGVGKDYDWTFFREYLIEGRLPDVEARRSKEILLSSYIANRLGFEIGDEFNMFFLKEDANKPPSVRVFTVVGFYDTGFLEFDESVAIADIEQIQRLNNWEEDQVGGFELFVRDFNQIKEVSDLVYTSIPPDLNTVSIVHKYGAIFEWIKLFDTNIILIIVIMIVVAGINMITALLVLILERTQMIGILRALGSTVWSVRKLFLYNASYLIVRGLIWGNMIGLGLLLLQHFFGVVTLDPETYYVKEAPVYIHFGYVLLLNVGTIVVCMLMLIVPSYIVSKISPVKAIKFD